MTQHRIIPIILSGGSGTRLWPLSRPDTPKQLLPIAGSRTMLTDTLERVAGLEGRDLAAVVCNEAHLADVRRDLAAADAVDTRVIVEPVGRNTAPAIAVAALTSGDDDPILLVMPADHIIKDVPAFHGAVADGARAAAEGKLVTFGVPMTHAATGYGYIRAGREGTIRPVEEFVEKPDKPTAERYLAGGEHLWNSGIFMFRASRYRRELDHHAPDVLEAALEAVTAANVDDSGALLLDEAAFAAAPSISIDHAVMEHTDNAVVISLDAGWTDVGSWGSLYAVEDKDAHGNVIVGDAVVYDVEWSYVRSEGPLVAVAGLKDVVVVATQDAVLVSNRHHSENVKQLVGKLESLNRPEAIRAAVRTHAWGSERLLTSTADTTAQQVEVGPGNETGMDAGTWIVMEGEGGSGGSRLTPGDVVTVPHGETIRVTNPNDAPLILLAVRSAAS
jgi:mannose-1-phosphate guanylyltransferase/mannose-6-phosphate isomerase